eukprot:GHVR01010197.1.p1 GENE.GHVR01010197.1~~GHVR01010197.1.p1  ORF type:complete len:179 (-),score=73.59 GHVR01010197.1:157-693(-)
MKEKNKLNKENHHISLEFNNYENRTCEFMLLCNKEIGYTCEGSCPLPQTPFVHYTRAVRDVLHEVRSLVDHCPPSSWLPNESLIATATRLLHSIKKELEGVEDMVRVFSGICFNVCCFKKKIQTHAHTHTRTHAPVGDPPLTPNSRILKTDTHTHTHTHTHTNKHLHEYTHNEHIIPH